jgi:hypothetical protein
MDQPFDRFFRKYGRALTTYANDLTEKPYDLIVAISRKAPRLLQLINQRTDLPSIEMDNCVCEKALPFIAGDIAGKDVLLTDDSIIFGSTFARVARELRSSKAKLNTQVLAISNAANESVAFGVNSALRLEATEISEFIDLEIQAFGSLAIPYDVDHPIVSVPLFRKPEEFERELRKRYPKLQDTTCRWQSYYSVRAFGVTPDGMEFHSLNHRQYGPSRVRFFIDHFRRQVTLVGIFCLCIPEAELEKVDLFSGAPAVVREVWSLLVTQVMKAQIPDERRYRALANAAHYLASFELLVRWLEDNKDWIDRDLASLSEVDLRLLWGPTIAASITDKLNEFLRVGTKPIMEAIGKQTLPVEVPQPFSEISTLAKTERGSEFLRKTLKYLSVASTENPAENLTALFEAQRWVWDEQTRNQIIPDSDRLEMGLSYNSIEELLQVWGSPVSEDYFAAWRDKAIDHGTIVPRYARAFSQQLVWLRVVRCGENLPKDAKVKLWLDYCLKTGIAAYRRIHSDRNQECLPWFLLEKMLVTLRAAMSSTINNELDIDSSIGFDEFGARVLISNVPRESFLVEYATQAGVFVSVDNTRVYRKDGPARPSRAFFRNQQFSNLYDQNRNPISPEFLDRTASLINTFFTIDSLFSTDQRTRTLLAITTCATEDAYLSAVSKELDIWLFHSHVSVATLALALTSLASVPDDQRSSHASSLAVQLGKSAAILLQTNVKRNAFRQREAIIAELDQVLREDGPNGPYSATWQNSIKRLIQIEPLKHTNRERYILFASALGKKAISIIRTVLSEAGLTEDPRQLKDRKPLEHHVDRYNRYVATAQQNGFTGYIPEKVDVSKLKEGTIEERLLEAARLLESTRAAVLEIWEFKRYPQPPNVMQPYEHDVAVLLYDLVDSGQLQAQLELQTSIHDLNDRIKHETTRRDTMGFHPDQDDGNAIVCKTVSDAVEFFRVIAETANDRGCLVKAAIESTVGGEKLWINKTTEDLGGRTYQVAARIMSFFKEAQSQASPFAYVDAKHKQLSLEQPTGVSYLVLSEHARLVLEESENKEVPRFLNLEGIGEKFSVRAVSALPTKVYCFSIRR